MKGGLRLALCVTLLLFFSLYLLEAHLRDICSQYRAGAYLVDWLDRKRPVQTPVPYNGAPEDKVIVMAKLEEESTDWVEEQLPEYVLISRRFSCEMSTNCDLISLLAGNGQST